MGQTVYPPTAGAPPSSPQLGHQPPQVNYQPTAISAPAQPPAQPCHPPNPQESNFFPSAGIYANASGYTGQPPHQLYRQSSYISGDYQSEKVVAAAYQTPSPDPVAQTHYATSSQTPSEYQAHATTGYPAQPPTVIMNSPLGQQQPGYTTPTVVVPAKCQTEPVMGNPIHSPMPMPQPQPMAIVHQLGRQSSYIPSVVEQPQSGPYYQPTQQLAGGGYAASGSTYQAQCFPPQEVVYGGQFSSYPATPSAALVPAERPAGGGLQYSVIPNPVPVVGLQYCLPRPVELMMVRKLTLSSDFTVMDVARTPIFKVKGKVVGDKRMLLDAAGIPVFSLNTKDYLGAAIVNVQEMASV
ncbi:OLC1v1033572C2 [Oldenlandia corymbosa var. corymbosa]|uniref:OLC1v1033572C2 n=1 Tax=Oldenlandia corymbosa var. corymbosa TaxID=529605 RepID=A0AAV1CNJ4_OLDCO|nr:OLC1v1033572C2 [Oldenlandia corymbosa var. corymbosa]